MAGCRSPNAGRAPSNGCWLAEGIRTSPLVSKRLDLDPGSRAQTQVGPALVRIRRLPLDHQLCPKTVTHSRMMFLCPWDGGEPWNLPPKDHCATPAKMVDLNDPGFCIQRSGNQAPLRSSSVTPHHLPPKSSKELCPSYPEILSKRPGYVS